MKRGKRKVRFSILTKIAVIGVVTSLIAAGVSLWFSSAQSAKREEENLIEDVNNSLHSIEVRYDFSSADAGNLLADLEDIAEKAEEIYQENKDVELGVDPYLTFESFEKHFKEEAKWFYPSSSYGMGASLPYLDFRAEYTRLCAILDTAYYSSGAKAAYCAYYDFDASSYVFLADSRQEKAKDGEFYHLAGSHLKFEEAKTDSDVTMGTYASFGRDGHSVRYLKVYADEQKQMELAVFFIEYDLSSIASRNLSSFLLGLAMQAGISGAVILLIILGSYFTFYRNIKKLTGSANLITDRLSNNENFEVVEPTISSKDEVKELSDAFVKMEREIVNYIDIVKEETASKERVDAELGVASKIQLGALPSPSFHDGKVDLEASIKTAVEVGGDFYDYFYLDDNRLAIIISDVSGKGIPASLFMMRGKEIIKSLLLGGKSLEDAASSANKALAQNNEEGLFVTSFIGIIDFKKEELSYVNAGHEKPYIIDGEQVIRLDGESNFVLGGEEEMTFLSESIPFKKGEEIFLFTDGLNEAINEKEEEFGYENIRLALMESKGKGLREKLNYLNEKLGEFTKGKEAFDDCTMMLVSFSSRSLTLHYEKKEYSIIEEAVDAFSSSFSYLLESTKQKVGIILDELLNNAISYEEREDLKIDLSFLLDEDELHIEFITNGSEYDITKNHKEKKYVEGEENPEEGGLGIGLVKEFSKSLTYSYENGQSVIRLVVENRE